MYTYYSDDLNLDMLMNTTLWAINSTALERRQSRFVYFTAFLKSFVWKQWINLIKIIQSLWYFICFSVFLSLSSAG